MAVMAEAARVAEAAAARVAERQETVAYISTVPRPEHPCTARREGTWVCSCSLHSCNLHKHRKMHGKMETAAT